MHFKAVTRSTNVAIATDKRASGTPPHLLEQQLSIVVELPHLPTHLHQQHHVAAAAAECELGVHSHEAGNNRTTAPIVHGATQFLRLHAQASSGNGLPSLDARAGERLAEAPLSCAAGILVAKAQL